LIWFAVTAKDEEEALRRMLIIARLSGIERLNGSLVSSEERDTANRTFTRHHTNAKTKPSRYQSDHVQ